MTKKSFTIRIRRTDCISLDLFEGLRNLGLYFINTLSPYFDHCDLGEYVQPFTARGVLTAISNLYKGKLDVLLDEKQAERRHDVDTTKQADKLRQFFDEEKLEEKYIQVLKYLPLFKRASNLGGYWSVVSASKYSWEKKVVYEENLGDLLPQNLYPPGMVVFSRDNHCKWLTRYFDEITMPNRVEFVLDYFIPIIASNFYPVKLLDELMIRLLQQLHTLKDLADKILNQRKRLIEALSNLSFLRYDCEKTDRKPPNVLYDSRVEEVKTIFKDEPLFPLPPFHQPHILDFLHECHLRNTVTSQEIVDVIYTVSGKTTTRVEIERVKGILDCIQSHPDYLDIKVKFDDQKRLGTLKECVAFVSEKMSWLPIEICPPSTYPKCLVWKGRSSSHSPLTSLTPTTFTCTEEQLLSSSYIAGSEVYIVKLPESINAIFRPTVKLPVECVIKHFKNVIKNCNNIGNKQLDDIVRMIYSFLQDNKQYTELVKCIVPGFKWIWIRKQHKFVSSSMVAMKTNHSLSIEPYFFFIENQEEFGELFEQLGVCKNISKSQVLSVLKEIHDLGKTSDCARKAVMSILEWLSNNEQEEIDADAILYVPIETQDPKELKMEDSRNVCYTDMEFLTEYFESTEEKFTLCHNEINKLGELLHLIPLSQKLGIADDMHEDVGQYESLACRIKNILRDYTDGITIVKELLQNADDAEATEVNLCYDTRRHDVDPTTLVFSGMAKCNGPALVVHNNAVFKKEDFENIQKLAGATKKDKPLKIGKFGVGFCSVYHITDVPSFVSQEYLYVFDPTLQYLEKNIQDRSRPGKRLKYTGKIAASRISKQLTPYIGLYGFELKKIYDGTMFRLPFRSSSSDLSSIMYTGNHIDRLKEDIEKYGSKLLLFLQNVKHITFSRFDEGDESPKMVLDIHKETLQSPTVDTRILSIRVHATTDTVSDNVCHWLVGFHAVKVDFNEQQRDVTASVACQMQVSSPPERHQYSVKPIEGEVFCFLPLALPSGIPCHISANFAVSNNRTGIQSSEDHNSETNEAQWNLQLVVPQAYLNMLQCLTELHAKEWLLTNDYPNNFYCLWPLKIELKTHDPWDNMLEHFYRALSKKRHLFSKYAQQWLKPSQSSFLSSKILSVTQEKIPEVVHEIITLLKVKVVDIPLKYQKHIHQSTIMQELNFVKLVFEQIAKLTEHFETRNQALLLILQRCAQYKCDSPEKREFQEYLKKYECVPCTPNGEVLKHCNDIIDPRAFFAELYEPTDGKFPIEFRINSVYSVLTDLGISSKRLSLEKVVERTTTIQFQCRPKALQRTRLIFECLKVIFLPVKGAQKSIRHQALNILQGHTGISELKAIKFVPVKQRPKDYPSALCWKGDNFTILATNEIYYGEQCATLAGSQVCVVCTDMPEDGGCGEIDNCVISELGMRTTPQFAEVVEHFSHIIRKLATSSSFNTKWVTKVCSDIYKFIEKHLKLNPPRDLGSLTVLPCIWTGSCFVESSFVAQEWPQNGPHFFRLPNILSDKKNIRSALNIKINFTVADLAEAMNKLKERFDCQPVFKEYRKFVYTLVPELGMRMGEENWSDEKGLVFFLPDSHFVMRKANELEYNDAAQWYTSSSIQVHEIIPQNIAIKLGVRLMRAKLIESYEDNTMLLEGEDFGQSEELTQRISNILRDYPLDITILKELLQNADDARASKMYVILDKRCHGTEKVPSDEWKDLQGPALLVWNDSTFSEDDLRGIQTLGLGNKRSIAEKIGMFGIGFNVVYHLTDCPSFISANRDGDSTFCVLDPHCRYIPGANKMSPGRRFSINQKFWKLWSDLKPAYLQDNISELQDEIKFGSLFRFPLRYTKELMKKSKVVDLSNRSEPLQPDSIEEKLTKWAPDMRDSLFFLNNVSELSFYVIDDNNKIQHTHWYKVQITGDGQQSRARIQNNVNCFGKSDLTPHIERYTVILTDMLKSNATNEKWLVQQGVGDMEIPDNQWKYLPQMKPKHGIATPISVQRASNIQCRVFCFLPLPIFSHLPVHINGNFILDSSRRNLWQPTNPEKPDDQDQWNKKIFEAIASSYTQLLTSPELQTAIIDPSGNESRIPMLSYIKHYYDVFPKWLCDSPPEGQYLTLSRRIYAKLCKQNATVLVKLIQTDGNATTKYTAIFLPLFDRISSQNQAYFYNRNLSEEIVSITERIGMQLTEAPNFVHEHLKEKVPQITRYTVYEHYAQFYTFVSPNQHFPCLITATKFESVEIFKQFTEYLLGSFRSFPKLPFGVPHSKLPIGVPLLLTADNYLRKFDKNLAIRTKFSSIFAENSDMFLHSTFIEVIYPDCYFLNCSPKGHRVIVFRIISGALSEQLKCKVVLDASASIDSNLLQQLWNCFIEDRFFNIYLKQIIEVWALIPSTSNQLFSLKSKVLPVIPQSGGVSAVNQSIIPILEKLSMPFLDTKTVSPTVVSEFCPLTSKPSTILKNLYYLHQEKGVLEGQIILPLIKPLLEYFRNIHLTIDKESRSMTKQLPLFNGRFCSIPNGGFIWPECVCETGMDKWLLGNKYVFLDADGDWTCLNANEALKIKPISPYEVYNTLIFPVFHELTEQQRNVHLLNIRDTLLVRAVNCVQLHDKYHADAKVFEESIRNLNFLPKADETLGPPHAFADPRKEIFKTFEEHFIFPPSSMQDDKWLTFLRGIGLQTSITTTEYLQFCSELAERKHSRKVSASHVLLEYLFQEKEWHEDKDFLDKVSKIDFVRVEPLPDVHWIHPCTLPEKTIQGSDVVQRRARIQNNVNCFGKSDLTPHIERYTVILTDMLKSNATNEKWLVQQGVGDMEIPDNQWKYLPQMKPKHGIATPISVQRASNIQCRVFCFLPLPIFSHLPVHINGNFILDSSRRNLWQPTNPEKPDDQDQWNKKIFEAIASSYTQLLTSPELQTAIIDPSGNESRIPMLSYIKHYYDVFPKWLCDSPPEGQYLTLSRRIYAKLCKQNATVLVKLIQTDGNATTKYTAIFLPLFDRISSQNQAYFYNRNLSEEIVSITERIGMQLTEAPNFVHEHLKEKVPQITRYTVYEHYAQFYTFVSPNQHFPCLITATKFESVEIFKQFTEYLLGSFRSFPKLPFGVPHSKLPIGVPLLLTADNYLRKFDKNLAIRTKFSSIFAENSDMFLHSTFIEVIYPDCYFLNCSPKGHRVIVFRIISGALSEQLKCKVVLDASASIDSNLLQQLWNCFIEDRFFNIYLKQIIEVWALIPSTSNQLFSLKSKVLPVIPQSGGVSAVNQSIIPILEKLSMPFLDTKTVSPTVVSEFCPLTSKPSTILKNLYYLHQEKGVLEGQIILPLIKPLLEYFRNIHLTIDKESRSMTKQLPLFNGRFCSIPNGGFIWPECVCETGMDKWLLGNKYVFLDADGDWTCLNANEALKIKPISPYEVYNTLIFPVFHELTEQQRNVHLLNIRDTLLVRAVNCVQLHDKYHADAKVFEESIRNLNFLPKADETLGPPHAFADPRKEIFKTFEEHFIFPPSSMQDDKWLTFLRGIGLQTSITTTEYLQFCSELAERKHSRKVSASHVLLEYLFQEKEWHEDKDFLDKVSKIDFVRVEPLPDVHWIHPCTLPEKTIQGSDVVQQTSLAKAAEHKDYKLIWTVSPVVCLPSGGEALLQKLHISTASVEMVIENIRNISSSALSDFHNFETYTCNRPAKGESIISVLYENFCFLKDNVPSGSTAEVLSALCSIPCIPVCAEGNVEDIQRPVLVKPIQVIALPKNMVCQFKQYLSPLPKDMYSILPHVLARIGVEPAIMLKHVQGALETIHSVSRPDQPLDINTQDVVRCLLQKLYEILDNPPKHEEGSCCLKQIYLPNSQCVLVESQSLLYQDSEHYRKKELHFKESNFSELHLLVKKNKVSTYKFSMKQLCNLLPTEIAPKPMSTSCRAVISTSCQVEASLSPLARGLRQAFSVPLLAAGACAILKHNANPPDLCEKLKISLEQIFRNCEISTVRNLTVELWLDIKQASEHIGTAEVDFNIKKEDASFKLHVNKDARKIFFFEALSTAVMTQAAEMNSLSIKDISKPQEALTYLLKVESSDDVRSTLREIGVHEDLNTDASGDEYNAEFDPNLSPELGMPIPDSWHHRLQQDYNNLFRPQDWVGYEVQDDKIVFAQILYKNPDEKIFDSYFITIKSNEKKKVSVIYLYKILQSAGNEDHSLVPHEGSTKPEDMASNITITSVKKEICAELRRIWKLPEELKRKALKRMYLKWHPDKNPDNIELTEEAFKFLKRQIARLEAGKSLVDPDQEDDSSDSQHTTSSPFDDLFETWNRRARQHKRYKKREYSYYRRQRDKDTNAGAGSSRWGTSPSEKFEAPQPEPGTAQDWIRQAECDHETLLVLSKELHNHRQVCANACYLSYEVAEVSIMAGMFAVCGLRQRNRKRSHSIGNYAGALIQMEPSLTHGLQDHVKRVTVEEYNKRWPETGRPALNFTPEQAEQAIESALAIFEMMKNVVAKSQK